MAESIGTLSKASGSITAVNSEGQERVLSVGDPIFEGDVLTVAGGGSSAGITFNNGCMMTLSEGESALIDETAYKLEFYDDAEVVVDLESVEGISEEVAALDNEDEGTIEDLSDIEGSEENINISDLDETASGEETSSTLVGDSDVQERLEPEYNIPETTVIGSDTSGTGGGEGVTVTEVERGGETTDSTPPADTTAPVTPTVDVSVGGDSGFTNDNTPELSGTGEAGTTIVIYDTYIGDDGSTQTTIIGETTVGDDSNWNYTTDPLADGVHTIAIESVDDAGNSAMNENVASFTIDTVAPDAPNITPIDFTNDTTPTISGEGSAGDSVTVRIGENTYTTTVDDSGYWEIVSEDLTDGSYEVVVTMTDEAGNVSPVQTSSFTVDTTAPDAPQVTDITMTDPTNVTISGNAEADSELEVTMGDNTENLTTNSDGTWSIDFTGLSEGEHTVTITASDSSGNTSTTVLASIIVDSGTVTYDLQLDDSVSGGELGLESVTIHAFSNGDFDSESDTLNLSDASTEDVSIHDEKGIGASGETQGENKATSEGEAIVIELEEETQSIDIDISKLSDNENATWVAYDEDMQKIGEGTFSGDDINIEGQEGTLTIDQDNVDGAFSYIVLAPGETDNGQPSSFFVTDVSYGGEDDTYTYNLALNELPDSDASDTDLYIEGLSGDVVLEDSDGNAIGSYNDDGMWVISSDEMDGLVEDGSLDLQIVSNTEIDLDGTDFQFTTVDIAYNTTMNYDSPLATEGAVFDFDSLAGMQTLNMSDNEVEDTNLSLQDVLALSNGATQLGIISGEVDNHSLTLDSDSWTLKTDIDGNPVTIENDEGSFVVYSSTDANNAFDLVVDEMITVVLES